MPLITFALEIFTLRDQNLRRDALEMLFNRISIPNVWAWIEDHPNMRRYLAEALGGAETAGSQLNTFVSYRNDAAHGVVNNVLLLPALLLLGDFIEVLCEVLAERMNREWMLIEVTNGTATHIGDVVESYPVPNAIVISMENQFVSVGDSIVGVNENQCVSAAVQELQLDGLSVDSVTIPDQGEVGIKPTLMINKGARLYRRNETSPFW